MEVKFGDGAVSGAASIDKHIRDIGDFIANPVALDSLKKEMIEVYNQKRDLGLITPTRALQSFSDENPMLILFLINHDPASAKLESKLSSVKANTGLDIHIASGCFMGYGLFDQAILPLKKAKQDRADCIRCR